MSNTQKKININNLLNSDNKNSINEKTKIRNYKTFIKRIKTNSTEKLEFSLIKNQNTSHYQNQNILNNLTNLNNQTLIKSNDQNSNSLINNLDFQSINFCSKEKTNQRYSNKNVQNYNSVIDKKLKAVLQLH